jgi:hypothetical protein
MNKFLIAGVATAAIVGLAPALAQTARTTPQAHTSHHGAKVHTRAEVEAKVARHFARVDTNGDGFVTRAEGQAAAQVMHAKFEQRMAQRRTGARAGGMHRMGERMFKMADANNDGRVSLQEAQAAALHHFDMADANRDGQVTPEERRQMRQQMGHERRPG